MGKKRVSESERFWSKVDKSGECWLWIAGKYNGGYGQFSVSRGGQRISISAHRWSFLAAGGEVPEGQQLHHTCNNRGCVNPAHLVAVSAQENIVAITKRAKRAPIKFGRYQRTAEPSTTMSFHCPDNLQSRLRATAVELDGGGMSAFTCPICRAHCPTLADILSCHPRQTRALTGRAHSSNDVIAVLSGEQLAGQRRPVRAAVADQGESEAADDAA